MMSFEFLMLRNIRTSIQIKSFQMIKTVTKQIKIKNHAIDRGICL